MAFLDLFSSCKKMSEKKKDDLKLKNKTSAKTVAIKNGEVLLPKTDFPMKADLANREKEILDYWQRIDLYGSLRKASKGRSKFVLHLGPPYANGEIHTGHALNIVLKDIVGKNKQKQGYDVSLVPGWDCHGLPIEWKVEEGLREKKIQKEGVDVPSFLSLCREFAKKWIEVQKSGLVRLGVCADWENPYITMKPKSEGVIVRQFLEHFMNGYVYRGQKPVMWSVVEKTALAEAEVEYCDHVSNTVYVAFPIVSQHNDLFENAEIVIWTTTPWTLPANRAIAYNSSLDYCVIAVEKVAAEALEKNLIGRHFVVANDLCANFCEKIGITKYSVIGKVLGSKLSNVVCKHPFAGRLENIKAGKKSGLAYDSFEVRLFHSDHVTIEAGTGLVHIAPCHGLDDFFIAKRYDIAVPEVVGGDGLYVDGVPIFAGKHVFKIANEIIDVLREEGALLAVSKITHSYPHSWRSRSPLIFRLTHQWFFDIDRLRKKSLEEIEKTTWYPKRSKNRIRGMVESRPDWCLSRQRLWGVPVALFLNKETGEPLRDAAVNEKIVEIISIEGIEAWHKYDADYFLSDDKKGKYEKVLDTLDVWFDSACTHHFVLEEREDLSWPADMYLEGADQHRGWFQSSLIESIASKGKSPYKSVFTHGFVLDKNGKKMSKSLGNVISCSDLINKYGADLVRLWAVSSDVSEDVRIGEEIVRRQEDIYRKFRNTLRYLLGSISDFSEEDSVKYEDLPELEKYILHRLYKLNENHKNCLENFEFPAFYSDLHVFCANDLSSFYFDIRKDTLYCDDQNSLPRRAAQTVMNILFSHIVNFLAPVLSFTAEEAWQHYKYNKKESVHQQFFTSVEQKWNNLTLENRWRRIRDIRRVIMSAIEQERLAKTINSSLQANVVCFINKDDLPILEKINMADVAIVSNLTFLVSSPTAVAVSLEDVSNVGVVVTCAEGNKCKRCWKIVKEYKSDELCERCFYVVN